MCEPSLIQKLRLICTKLGETTCGNAANPFQNASHLVPRPNHIASQSHIVVPNMHQDQNLGVSPEFVLWPSLSDPHVRQRPEQHPCVAGVCAPAFVERSPAQSGAVAYAGVAGVCAPAFVERCVQDAGHPFPLAGVAGVCAPAFVERSEARRSLRFPRACVAGVCALAFVERCRRSQTRRSRRSGVAGVCAPAFVERTCVHRRRLQHLRVSPEFVLRPSLSECLGRRRRQHRHRGVAGVCAPAFVERLSIRTASITRRRVSPEFVLRPSLSVPSQHLG